MLDHCGINVSNFEKSKIFYSAALKPLGYELLMEFGGIEAGFGKNKIPDFWIKAESPVTTRAHIAFRSVTREPVRQFYSAATDAGGKDNGGPGLRKNYSPTYYAAFVFDPDGNNIEIVCQSNGE